MALALSLPLAFPDREEIINMTFGVVLFTLLVPGLTMEPLVRVLGMAPKDEKLRKYQEYKALLLAYRSELQTLSRFHEQSKISTAAYEHWKDELQLRILELSRNIDNLQLSDSSIDEMQDRQARIQLLEARKDYLSGLVKDGLISSESAHHLAILVDSELDGVAGSAHGGPAVSEPQAGEPIVDVAKPKSDQDSQAQSQETSI